MTQSQINRPFEFCLLALLALFWGSSYLFIKVALEGLPPLTLIAIRVSLAAALLYLVARWQGHDLPSDLATWRRFFVQCFYHYESDHMNVVNAVLMKLFFLGQQHYMIKYIHHDPLYFFIKYLFDESDFYCK